MLCDLNYILWDEDMDPEGNGHGKTGSVWNVDILENTGDFLGEESNICIRRKKEFLQYREENRILQTIMQKKRGTKLMTEEP